eukprot:12898552-Prorocentrum_lima.AAC.1
MVPGALYSLPLGAALLPGLGAANSLPPETAQAAIRVVAQLERDGDATLLQGLVRDGAERGEDLTFFQLISLADGTKKLVHIAGTST